jgi:hypothetical protein
MHFNRKLILTVMMMMMMMMMMAKVVLVLNRAPRHEGVLGSGGMVPLIF